MMVTGHGFPLTEEMMDNKLKLEKLKIYLLISSDVELWNLKILLLKAVTKPIDTFVAFVSKENYCVLFQRHGLNPRSWYSFNEWRNFIERICYLNK